ncbi:MAG TPA: ATP-dependent zinc metalloprotease FtsH [Acidimicrobiales bacterium]|nr:ATP-dependent zinc metalloprotease FtsH [Acidimicrobiales bacterium]
MRRFARSRWVYLALAVIVALVVLFSLQGGSSTPSMPLSQFESYLSAPGKVVTATIHDDSDVITGKLSDGSPFRVSYPDRMTQALTDKLLSSGAKVDVTHSGGSIWPAILENWAPIILLGALFAYLIFASQGGGSRVMAFGKAKARTANKDQPKVTFADVAGADEAVAELQEIKEFLENPARFQALGAKIPKGVLLFGPPGTGKTLLARAVAGEAGVPFFSISGSDFVEMFVGVGASRVRDLFEQAKANAPSIVFMDEIDAVGRHRGAGLGGGHDEREQTLNQLLVEMDGFDVRGGVILIAATNRPDILDPALLRPGRFDRQIVVDRPDLTGRRKILEVHGRGKPLARSADLDVLAKRTPGFTGADLANLLNEAAILTARRNLRQIGMRECEEAIDRVLAGPERKTLVMSDHDKLVTAYHEAGHAIVGHVLAHADPIHKVSIVARSRSLGLTYTLPEDRFNHSRSQLRDTMAMCLGGRTAEEIVFSEPTTGAENDIEKVTRIARAMVTEYGMSDALGPQQLGQRDGEVFLGRDLGHQANYSEEVAAVVDREIRALIDEAHRRARAVLLHHRPTLDRMARELVDKETLDALDLEAILGPLAPWPTTGKEPARARRRPVASPPGGALPGPAEPVPPRRRPVVAPGRAVPAGAAGRTAAPRGAVAAAPAARARVEPGGPVPPAASRKARGVAAPARKAPAATATTAGGRRTPAGGAKGDSSARTARPRPKPKTSEP